MRASEIAKGGRGGWPQPQSFDFPSIYLHSQRKRERERECEREERPVWSGHILPHCVFVCRRVGSSASGV